MNLRWPRIGRRERVISLVAVCIATIGFATPRSASAIPVFGGQFYYTGGDVTVDVLFNNTVYGEVLLLRSSLGSVDVADGSRIGTKVTLTADQLANMGIGIGDELQFGIHVLDTRHDYFLGSADRNADGIIHSYIRPSPVGHFYVGFEDLFGGGDRDYNDTIFRFSGGLSINRPERQLAQVTVPEPAAWVLLIGGIALLSLRRRIK